MKKQKRKVDSPAWFVQIKQLADGRYVCRQESKSVFATGDTEGEAYQNFIMRYPEL